MARQSAAHPARGRAARGRRSKLETACEDQVPDVYQEMLEEAEARDPGQFHLDRPIKRRRVGDSKSIQTRAIPVDSPPLEQANMVLPPGKISVRTCKLSMIQLPPMNRMLNGKMWMLPNLPRDYLARLLPSRGEMKLCRLPWIENLRLAKEHPQEESQSPRPKNCG